MENNILLSSVNFRNVTQQRIVLSLQLRSAIFNSKSSLMFIHNQLPVPYMAAYRLWNDDEEALKEIAEASLEDHFLANNDRWVQPLDPFAKF